ncbi:hypothetical protein M011DRAFT_476024 [Sporormia fimetaria CBS 119925]|uniref:Uncharacterized protein n=1 Tax=Sporormia fimetaria CBS 119925 TaxID=1340428 RepID=A0A6A6VFP2_9PLEO|nr:hypothetical protein M011DRAFT_476024 [Sporormia fimetaria CBS 119925]
MADPAETPFKTREAFLAYLTNNTVEVTPGTECDICKAAFLSPPTPGPSSTSASAAPHQGCADQNAEEERLELERNARLNAVLLAAGPPFNEDDSFTSAWEEIRSRWDDLTGDMWDPPVYNVMAAQIDYEMARDAEAIGNTRSTEDALGSISEAMGITAQDDRRDAEEDGTL